MANNISLTAPVRTNLVSLQQTADLLASTQERLATGKKVNRAIDNPQSFFTAAALNNRASDLSSLLDNAGQAVQTLKAADSGIEGLSNLLTSAKAVLIQAQDTKISGSSTTLKVTSGSQDVEEALGITDGEHLQIVTNNSDGANPAQSVELTDALTVSELATQLNALDGVNASYSGDTLTVEATNGRDLQISTTATADSTSDARTSNLDGTFTNGINRDNFAVTYNNLLTQIDQLVSDSSYKGVNLLRNDNLTVYFNEDQTSSLEISGANLTTDGDLNLSSTSANDLETDTNIASRLDAVDAATLVIRDQSSTFGANLSVVETRSDFTQSLINTLEEGAGLLTLADTNEEGANLLALQTRQQLSSISLSLASQADQAVLSLF